MEDVCYSTFCHSAFKLQRGEEVVRMKPTKITANSDNCGGARDGARRLTSHGAAAPHNQAYSHKSEAFLKVTKLIFFVSATAIKFTFY